MPRSTTTARRAGTLSDRRCFGQTMRLVRSSAQPMRPRSREAAPRRVRRKGTQTCDLTPRRRQGQGEGRRRPAAAVLHSLRPTTATPRRRNVPHLQPPSRVGAVRLVQAVVSPQEARSSHEGQGAWWFRSATVPSLHTARSRRQIGLDSCIGGFAGPRQASLNLTPPAVASRVALDVRLITASTSPECTCPRN
jgi:hypothetical protein